MSFSCFVRVASGCQIKASRVERAASLKYDAKNGPTLVLERAFDVGSNPM